MERDSGHHQGSVPSSKITISENALVADVGDEACPFSYKLGQLICV